MRLIKEMGRVALGTRVRYLGDRLGEDATKIYELYGITMNPKWFPVFYALSREPGLTIGAIAADIGHSHVSVSKIVAEMTRAGLVADRACPEDGRRTLVRLTKRGERVAERIEGQYLDVRAAVDELAEDASSDLWRAIEEWESLLEARPMLERVRAAKRRREAGGIRVVDYAHEHRAAFRDLNVEWISTFFEMEKADFDALDDPEGYVLARGGAIFVALVGGEVAGVCALLRRDDDHYPLELAKMAVSPKFRGLGVGLHLGRAVVARARALGAKHLYLESNTVLGPALALYRKLGFREITGAPTPYARCNVQMELAL